VILGIPGNKDTIIGGDMNKRVDSEMVKYERGVHGGYSESNDARIFDFASLYELAIINTYFRKIEEHYITYKSERNRSQIDYFI
jgi:hypothetical protein